MQVKSYKKSDNVREKAGLWNDSTRGTIYTSPYKNDKTKAFPGQKQTKNLCVRKKASLCFYNVVSMCLHWCVYICISQITMMFAHKSVVDKIKIDSRSWEGFFWLCLVAKGWHLEKGKYVVFVSFREQNVYIRDWFSVNVMVTTLTWVGVSLDLIKSLNPVLRSYYGAKETCTVLCIFTYTHLCNVGSFGLLRLKQEFIISNFKATEN